MDTNDLIGIENQIDYKFKNRDLLQQAFVRRSYSVENGGANNEVLEFIGDKALDFVVVQLLTEEYGYLRAGSGRLRAATTSVWLSDSSRLRRT